MLTSIYFYFPTLPSFLNEEWMENKIFSLQNGLENWIFQTYYVFHKIGLKNIFLTNSIPEEGIVVFHSGYFEKNLKPSINQFFVCVAADYGRHRYAHIHVFQNFMQTKVGLKNGRLVLDKLFFFSKNIYIPHWAQPGIIPRNTNSQSLRKIGYFGLGQNLDLETVDFLTEFSFKNNLEFEIVEDYFKWNDYREFDLIISIRSLNNKEYLNKPFSKLINAIFAGVPLISGNESSARFFKQKYFPNLSIVDSKEELENEIIFIRDNYFEYLLNVQNCSKILKEIYPKEVIESWSICFETSITLFQKWKNSTAQNRELFFKSREL